MKSSFIEPNEDLPLKIPAFFIFPRIPVGIVVFICVDVTQMRTYPETEASRKAEDNVKSLTDLLLLFLQAKFMMAKLKRVNH